MLVEGAEIDSFPSSIQASRGPGVSGRVRSDASPPRARTLGILLLLALAWPADGVRAAPAQPDPNPISEFVGHEIHLGLEASVQLDMIHDFDAIGLNAGDGVPHEFVSSQIPVGGPAAQFSNRTLFSPNQSSLTLWASAPTRYGEARSRVVFNMTRDLFDTRFEVYKAIGEIGYLRLGLDYTLFLNLEALPDTLDFEGPPVFAEARFAQASLRFPVGRIGGDEENLFFLIGVEDAGAELTLPAAVENVGATSQVPAVTGKLTYQAETMNVELAGLYRRMSARGDNAYDSKLNGWGLHLSGFVRFSPADKVMFGVLGGRGIAAYIDDTIGLNLDAAPVSYPNGGLRTVGLVGAWAGYERKWSRVLKSTATISFLKASTDFIDRRFGPAYSPGTPTEFVGIFQETFYSSANLIWSPVRWLDTGVEYLYGHRKVAPGTSSYGSNEGHDSRIQFTIRLNFEYSR